MPEITCIGSALADIFIHSHHFTVTPQGDQLMLCQVYGDKVEVEQFQVQTGGGASNTATAFKRLGYNVAIVAELGQDNLAGLVEQELAAEGVSVANLIHEKKEQTGGSVILIGPDGGRTVLVHRGAAAMLDVADLPLETLRQTRWIHLSSIGGRLEVLQTIFQLARENNIGLSWNPGKAELQLLVSRQLAVADVSAHLLVLNKEEWDTLDQLKTELATRLYQVIVTNGDRGGQIWWAGGAETLEYPSPATTSVDDTGAGDAFGAAYVSAYLSGLPPVVAAQWGVANALSVIQSIGAKTGLLSRSKLETLAAPQK